MTEVISFLFFCYFQVKNKRSTHGLGIRHPSNGYTWTLLFFLSYIKT